MIKDQTSGLKTSRQCDQMDDASSKKKPTPLVVVAIVESSLEVSKDQGRSSGASLERQFDGPQWGAMQRWQVLPQLAA